MESILSQAIESAQQSEIAYCKFISSNDAGKTGAHQSGYYIGKPFLPYVFEQKIEKGIDYELLVTIKWQSDFETDSRFKYYGSKNECHLTRFQKSFPFLTDNNVGDLLIICKVSKGYYNAFVLQTDEEIEDFFAALNISSSDTNGIIPKQFEQSTEDKLLKCFTAFLKGLKVDFPPTIELATNSRNCYNAAYNITKGVITQKPDKSLLDWLDAEFSLFKIIENDRYNTRIKTPFGTVEELVKAANTILNRRKSRAGASLELHLSEIFKTFEIAFDDQKITEDRRKPDFIFPSVEAYHNPKFRNDKLTMLASKTTCKDRWRQILNEAERIKTKHLFTLQQGISRNQLEEMYKSHVCLVVPAPYLASYPKEFRDRILTLENFLGYAKALQV